MGKRIRAQRKGHSLKYRATSHRHKGVSKYSEGEFTVNDISHNTAKNTPLVRLTGEENTQILAAEGVSTGQVIHSGESAEVAPGNILPLKSIPEGVPIFNIEGVPGDNGSFIRSGGSFGFIVSKKNKIVVKLPSKKTKEFHSNCRATVGIAAGGGRVDKPFVKAGTKYHRMKSRSKLYPVTAADSMNAVDHPMGGRTKKGRPMNVSRTSPPGQKVGSFGAKRMGKGKGKRK